MRISDWSSDVCSSDLSYGSARRRVCPQPQTSPGAGSWECWPRAPRRAPPRRPTAAACQDRIEARDCACLRRLRGCADSVSERLRQPRRPGGSARGNRSEEHTSELQSLMRISYAVFCLKKKIQTHTYRLLRTLTLKRPTRESTFNT